MIPTVNWPTGQPKGWARRPGDRLYRQVERMRPLLNVRVRVWDTSTPELNAQARRGAGRLLNETRGHNLVPTVGRNLLRDLLDMNVGSPAPGPLTQFAIGDDSTPTSNNDTELGNQLLIDAITRTISSDLELQVQYFLPSTALNGEDIWEAGLFTDADVMYARYVLGAMASLQPKTSAVAVSFTWDLTWTVTAMQILERGAVIDLGGNPDDFQTGNAYPTGATFDKLVPGSGVWNIDSADLAGGTFALEGIVKSTTGVKVKIALFNLDDGAPNTVLVGSEIESAISPTTGELVRSTAITFAAAGAAKKLGVKMTTDSASAECFAWGLRIIRLT